jgi:hypothetical protein
VVMAFVEGEEDASALKILMLAFGDVDGVALKLAGQAAEFGGIVGFAELVAEGSALLSERDEDGLGVVVDEFKIPGDGFELEVEEVVGGSDALGDVLKDVLLVGRAAVVPVVTLEVIVDRVEAERIGRVRCEDLSGGIGGGANEWRSIVLGGFEKEELAAGLSESGG